MGRKLRTHKTLGRAVEHALFIIDAVLSLPKEASICYENVAVRIESKKIAKRLHGDDSAAAFIALNLLK